MHKGGASGKERYQVGLATRNGEVVDDRRVEDAEDECKGETGSKGAVEKFG